ncbi:hypothetical protein Bca52824_069327 [Brassica carinata]|uniref:3-beta hydroxysteroid dehydrogenase/isomerase domain-containing protein n=1 Tax=Brassica carinata TaxID=52824 RepID=A0A8X7Q5K7_BRACI|nr:hypothetical protein Bca52824_069327 [Brassica carinata]
MTTIDQTAVTTGTKKACVIGGTGNLASILIKHLLQSGYKVNTTVRDPENEKKTAHLKVLQELGDLKIFKADLTDEGSFTSPISGCEYVFHVATPISFTSQDPEKDMISPAVQGVINVLKSCLKSNSVKRVIYTSSAAAVSINNLSEPGLVMTEENWSDVDFLTKEKPFNWKLSGSISFIHVDDLARAHMFLAEKETASGRYICCYYNTNVPEIADFLRRRYPKYNVLSEFEECLSSAKLTLSSEKLVKEGFRFEHGISEMYDEMIEYFESKGLIKPV